MAGIVSRIETITPEMARAYLLTKADDQRPIKYSTVAAYSRDMTAFKWVVNNDAICWDENGRLINGQHRLLACIQANVPFTTLTLRGVPHDAYKVMDRGTPRLLSDLLSAMQYTKTRTLSGAISILWYFDRGIQNGPWSTAPTIDEAIATLDLHPGLVDSVGLIPNSIVPLAGSRACMAAMHYFFAKKDPEAATAFIEQMIGGENITKSDPVFVLRERLVRNAASKRFKLKRKDVAFLMVKAWNATRGGYQVKTLKAQVHGESGSQDFPVIS